MKTKDYTSEQVARVLKRRGAMDICTQPGMEVVFATFNAGYEMERKRMEEFGFVIGRRYKVAGMSVGRSSSTVNLEGFENQSFNTVFFCNRPREVVTPNDTYFECKLYMPRKQQPATTPSHAD